MKTQPIKLIVTCWMITAAGSAISNAQIIYTDINPDTTVNTNLGVYPLDMNNDGQVEFNINYTFNVIGTCTRCSGTQTNYYVKINFTDSTNIGDCGSYDLPCKMDSLDLISSSSLIWSREASMMSDTWACPGCITHIGYGWVHLHSGNWGGASNNYLPLEFRKNGNTYYGWARLAVSTNGFTVKDYAYNSDPGQPILAGDTGQAFTGIHDTKPDAHFSMVASGKTVFIKSASGISPGGTVFLTNTLGQKLGVITFENRAVQIDMSSSAGGIYFVTFLNHDAIETRKIYIQ